MRRAAPWLPYIRLEEGGGDEDPQVKEANEAANEAAAAVKEAEADEKDKKAAQAKAEIDMKAAQEATEKAQAQIQDMAKAGEDEQAQKKAIENLHDALETQVEKETALQQAQFEENLASLEVETAKEAQEKAD